MRIITILFVLISSTLFGQVKDVNITISANHDADSVYILATHDTGTKAGRGVFRSLVYLAELIDPYLDAHKNMVDSISSEVVTEGQVEIKIWSVGDPIDSTTIDVSGEPTLINDFLIDGDSLCITWSYFDAGVYLPQRQCILTSSIGGGGSQGIDDVLAIGQALTAARTITTGANEFNIDGTGTMLIGAVTGGNSTYVVVGDSDQQIYLNANEVATSNALNVGGAITASNLSGTNTGDQTSIVGITGTKAQFNTAVTDGDFLYVGDVTSNATHTGEVTGATALTVDKAAITNKTLVTTAVEDHVLIADASDADNLKKVTVQTIVDLASGGSYTDEQAQDAVGGMVDGSLTYVDATPLLQRAALTGAITASAGSNTTALGSFTKAELDGAISDGNGVYAGDDHGVLGGLTDDDHTQYALLAGRAGSQVLNGGNAANEDLTLNGTAHATKTSSYVLLQSGGGNVGIGNSTPAALLDVGTYNTSLYTMRTGSFVLQPYAHNNGFIADNAYYNAGWTRLSAGYTCGFQFYNGQLIVFGANTGSGAFTQTPILKTDYANSGTVALGGNIDINSNTYTGGIMVVRGTGKVGINTTSADAALELNLGTTDKFRLTYNDANGSAATFVDETISSTGNVTFNSTGSAPKFTFSDIVNLTLPTYADEAAAVTGGLATGDLYKTATGEVRIKL